MAEKEERKISLGFKIFLIVCDVVIILMILGGAWLMNKFLIAPPLIVSFRILRVKIEKKYSIWHMVTVFSCMCLSVLICWFGLYLSLPLSISLISNIIIGAVFALLTWKIQEVIQIQSDYKALKEEIKNNKFDKTEKEKFIEKCKMHGYNDLKTQMAIKFFIDNEKPRDVWLWLLETKQSDIEWDSVKKIKYRMKKELFKE